VIGLELFSKIEAFAWIGHCLFDVSSDHRSNTIDAVDLVMGYNAVWVMGYGLLWAVQ